jgi:hypothetical protein
MRFNAGAPGPHELLWSAPEDLYIGGNRKGRKKSSKNQYKKSRKLKRHHVNKDEKHHSKGGSMSYYDTTQ